MRSAIAYVLAIFATVIVVAVPPSLFYVLVVAISVVRTGDIGGPLNFVIIPAAGVLVGLACAGLFTLLVAVFRRVPKLLFSLPAVVFILVFAVMYLWSHSRLETLSSAVLLAGAMAFWIALGSASYLAIFSLAGRLLRVSTS